MVNPTNLVFINQQFAGKTTLLPSHFHDTKVLTFPITEKWANPQGLKILDIPNTSHSPATEMLILFPL
jgi:hypothetical protein